MPESHTFQSLWFGDSISPCEALCLRSFIDNGHRINLYTYNPGLEVPAGVELLEASEILTQDNYITYKTGPGVGSPALFANLFRYKLLSERGGWWVDTDVICLSSDIPKYEQFFAFQDGEIINNAVLYFSPNDPILKTCLEEALAIGDRAQWGETGPLLLTRAVSGSDRLDQAQAVAACYPVHYRSALDVLRPSKTQSLIGEIASSSFLHLWNEMFRRDNVNKTNLPPKGSLLRRFADLHPVNGWTGEYFPGAFEEVHPIKVAGASNSAHVDQGGPPAAKE